MDARVQMLKDLHGYEPKMSEIMNHYFELFKRHGMLGDHLKEHGQVDPTAEGSVDIFHLVGSNADQNTACRNFNMQPTDGFQLEADILLELFEFDRAALGKVVKKARLGFYYIVSDESVIPYLRGKHFSQKQAIRIIKSMQNRDPEVVRQLLEEMAPWHDFDEDSTGKLAIRAAFERADGFIPPYILKKAVSIGVEGAQRNIGNPNIIFNLPITVDWTFENDVNGPAVTTKIRVIPRDMAAQIEEEPIGGLLFGIAQLVRHFRGIEVQDGSLSLDLVTCAKLNFWPDDASGFLTRRRKWPPRHVVQQCESTPVQIVPKYSTIGDENEWYLSFAFQEKIISEARTQDMKFTFYLFKILFYTHFKLRVRLDGVEESLSTYLAKTTMFWACEELQPDKWSMNQLNNILQNLLGKLLGFMEIGVLPHYFVPEINLLQNTPKILIDRVIRSVKDLLSDPVGHLPSEKDVGMISDLHHTVFYLMNLYKDKFEDVVRTTPWAIIGPQEAPPKKTLIEYIKGEMLTYKSSKGTLTVTWKQGSFLGIGGDKRQNYRECTYHMQSGAEFPVYIQESFGRPDTLTIDGRMQFGMNNGVLFLVLHDKFQRPYQHRFMRNPSQERLKWANDLQRSTTNYDLSWVAGDYLRDI